MLFEKFYDYFFYLIDMRFMRPIQCAELARTKYSKPKKTNDAYQLLTNI